MAFKEQNRQHSVTICAMEERLKKLMKKNKDYQDDISTHKKTIHGNVHVVYILLCVVNGA